MASREYLGQELRMFELLTAPRSALIQDASFDNCRMLGPAVVYLQDTGVVDCTFKVHQGDVESLLWPIPADKTKVTGVIVVRDCQFHGCTFEGVGFAGKNAELEVLRASIRG